MEHELWYEKYRPSSLDSVMLDPSLKSSFQKMIDRKSIPNLILIGPPGSGKTTVARILADSIVKDKSNILIINGSSNRGIDTVKDTIEQFTEASGFDDGFKIVFIDEFDYFTHTAQANLRYVIENTSKSVRYIFTGNYGHKIKQEISSRMFTINFETSIKDKDKLTEYLFNYSVEILKKEKIHFKSENIYAIIKESNYDFRKVVNTIQFLGEYGSLIEPVNSKSEEMNLSVERINKLVSLIISEATIVPYMKDIVEELYNVTDEVNYYPILYNKIFHSSGLSANDAIIVNKYYMNSINTKYDYIESENSKNIMNFVAMIYELVITVSERKQLGKYKNPGLL